MGFDGNRCIGILGGLFNLFYDGYFYISNVVLCSL